MVEGLGTLLKTPLAPEWAESRRKVGSDCAGTEVPWITVHHKISLSIHPTISTYQRHVADLLYPVPLGQGVPTLVFPPIRKQCTCKNTCYFVPMPAQDSGAFGTMAVHHVSQGRRSAEGQKPVQMLPSWPAKGCGNGTKKKESSTDKTEQPWCLESESQARVAVSQIPSSLLSAVCG